MEKFIINLPDYNPHSKNNVYLAKLMYLVHLECNDTDAIYFTMYVSDTNPPLQMSQTKKYFAGRMMQLYYQFRDEEIKSVKITQNGQVIYYGINYRIPQLEGYAAQADNREMRAEIAKLRAEMAKIPTESKESQNKLDSIIDILKFAPGFGYMYREANTSFADAVEHLAGVNIDDQGSLD